MRSLSRVIAALAAGGLAIIAILSPARADFTAPIELADHVTGLPAVAVLPSGEALVVWIEDKRTLLARTLSSAGALGPLLTIVENSRGLETKVASAQQGTRMIAWIGGSQLSARVLSPTGVLGPVLDISEGRAHGFDLAIGPDGSGVFVWDTGSDPRLRARAFSPEGALGPVKGLSRHTALALDVAMRDTGDAVIAYQDEKAPGAIQARVLTAAGVVSAAQVVSAVDEGAAATQVAVDNFGDAVIAWNQWDGGRSRVQARTLFATGELGPRHNLSPRSQRFALEQQLSVARAGNAIVAWTGCETDCAVESHIEVRAVSAAGALGEIHRVSSRKTQSSGPQLALDSDGEAIIAWQSFDGVGYRIETRSLSEDGQLGPVQGFPADAASRPVLGVDPTGRHAVVVWIDDRHLEAMLRP